jgi:hypothetical protein
MTKAIKITFIIFFCLNLINYIFGFLYLIKKLHKEEMCILLFLYIFNYIIYLIILSVNIRKFLKYWKYCPYLITDLDYNLHFERRCELYNINNNSRYSYQYICSFDSSKNFKKNNLKKEIKNDNIICIPVKEMKENEYNEVKNLFINEYKNLNNYYCSRTNIPKNYSFVNPKNCKKTKYFLNIALYIIFIFEYIFIYIILCFLFQIFISRNFDEMRRRRVRNLSNNDNLRNNLPNNIERNIENERIQNRNVNNDANRFRNFFRNLFNNINNNQLNDDTKGSENPYMDSSFIQQKTRNIILENKQEYSIETNIKNIISNKDNKKFNAINLDEINFQILKSEKNELGNNSKS